MTTYHPFSPRLRRRAPYSLDTRGSPVPPERLSAYSRDHDFSLPKCFHRRTVNGIIINDYNGNGLNELVFVCGLNKQSIPKCSFESDYKRQASSTEVLMDLPTPEADSAYVESYEAGDLEGLDMDLLEFPQSGNITFDDIDAGVNTCPISMQSEPFCDNNRTILSASGSYDGGVKPFLSPPSVHPFDLRTNVCQRNCILEEDIRDPVGIVNAVGRYIHHGGSLGQLMEKGTNGPQEALPPKDYDDDDDGNKENTPPPPPGQTLENKPLRRTRLITSEMRKQ